MIKNYINKTILSFSAVGLVLFGAMLDSDSFIPYVGCGVCCIVVLMYCIANGWLK